MAVYINLTGEELILRSWENDEVIVFAASPSHETAALVLRGDVDGFAESGPHRVVIGDRIVRDVAPMVTGLRFTPEPGATYIVPSDCARVLHGTELPFDVVYPDDGLEDEDGNPFLSGLVRLV